MSPCLYENNVLLRPLAPSPIDDTNVVTLSVQERVVAWVRGDNRYQCHLVCTRKCYCVPFITNRYQCHIVVRLRDIAYPQSPLDTGIPKSLPNPIPIMGMIQIQINRTRSTFTYKYLCNIPVYRCHYDGHDLNSNQLYQILVSMFTCKKMCAKYIQVGILMMGMIKIQINGTITVKIPTANSICERLHQSISNSPRIMLKTHPPIKEFQAQNIVDTLFAASYAARTTCSSSYYF